MLKLAIEQKHTDFDRALEIAMEHLGDPGDKKGFALYQHYRDFFLTIFADPVKTEAFTANDFYKSAVGDFNLCDKAYLDNFMLSMIVRFKAPQAYLEAVKIIDTYVRPETRNEGLNYFYQEIGGYLALLLTRQEQLSERQALRLAAYLVGYSETMVEAKYRERKRRVNSNTLTEPPHLLALIALYWALHKKNRDLSGLKPLRKHSRSVNELLKAKRAYTALTQKIINRHYPTVNAYLLKNPRSILHTAKNDFGVDLSQLEKADGAYSPFHVFVLLCCAFAMEHMPGGLAAIEKQYITTAPAA
jgi:hypothetical protein